MRKKKNLIISDKERKILTGCLKNNIYYISNTSRVILMYSDNEKIEDIMKATNLSRRTIFNYISRYKNNNRFMFSKRKKKNISPLQNYFDIIVQDFNNNIIKNYKEARARIKELTGIQISENRLRIFFRKNGIVKCKDLGRYIYNNDIKKKNNYY